MTFKQLQIFLTIVDTGNFKTAAKKLFMSAPSVSTHVTALEDEIGCKLFERKHSGTKLTTEGMKDVQLRPDTSKNTINYVDRYKRNFF